MIVYIACAIAIGISVSMIEYGGDTSDPKNISGVQKFGFVLLILGLYIFTVQLFKDIL